MKEYLNRWWTGSVTDNPLHAHFAATDVPRSAHRKYWIELPTFANINSYQLWTMA